jgi:aspartate/tyrosine/aromatic aminotransferase
MFERLETPKEDPILGLTEAFKKDPNPDKINLGVGVYKDTEGKTPVMDSVKQAEKFLLENEKSKEYSPISGRPEYGIAVQELVFGANHEVITGRRCATAHTPGGTGALRVAGDFLHTHFPEKKLWISDPTWPNHPGVFTAAGLKLGTYPYFDSVGNGLACEALLSALKVIPEGDAILLHGCCHNPTGADPSPEQWKMITEVVTSRNLGPLIDFAYQGLGDGLSEDAVGLMTLCRTGCEMLVASSFSKNFGLYNERVGALTLIGRNPEDTQKAFGHVKTCIRSNYSNPSFHGGAIVSTILGNPELKSLWLQELDAIRNRINGMRSLFVETLKAKGVSRDFSFIRKQKGMFSFSGLTKDQVATLREKYALYIVGSGRINVAGMTPANMDRLCEAIVSVL